MIMATSYCWGDSEWRQRKSCHVEEQSASKPAREEADFTVMITFEI